MKSALCITFLGLLTLLAVVKAQTRRSDEIPPPYFERVPIQLRQAVWDVRRTGDVFRFVRHVRHAVLPMFDRYPRARLLRGRSFSNTR